MCSQYLTFISLEDKMVRWFTKVLGPQFVFRRCGKTTFRWTLPLTQVVVCGLVLWPLRGDLIPRVEASFASYWSGKVPEQTVRFSSCALTDEQYCQEQNEGIRLCAPPSVNLPFLLFPFSWGVLSEEYSGPWAPEGLDYKIWWAVSSPFTGIFFWWVAGRGIDALLAARKGTIFPRIRTAEAVLGAIWAAFGMWFAVMAVLPDSGESGTNPCDILGVGGALWTLLGSAIVTAWLIQHRVQKGSARG